VIPHIQNAAKESKTPRQVKRKTGGGWPARKRQPLPQAPQNQQVPPIICWCY